MQLVLSTEITQLLRSLNEGDPRAADQLMPLVYAELRAIARVCFHGQGTNHTLEPTALVHEAYLKLVKADEIDWQGRSHFFALSARAMRQILVDHARRKQRLKRSGGITRIELREDMAISPQRDEDLLAVDEALNELEKLDPQQAKIVELRFFGGLTVQEVADYLNMSKRTVEREWTMIRAWLRHTLQQSNEP
jgi:RNA polymerase sigma-70 factor (ECF subfamily)